MTYLWLFQSMAHDLIKPMWHDDDKTSVWLLTDWLSNANRHCCINWCSTVSSRYPKGDCAAQSPYQDSLIPWYHCIVSSIISDHMTVMNSRRGRIVTRNSLWIYLLHQMRHWSRYQARWCQLCEYKYRLLLVLRPHGVGRTGCPAFKIWRGATLFLQVILLLDGSILNLDLRVF